MSASGSEVSCFRMPVTPTTVALKTLVFSMPVALRSAVHERQQRLRSQLLSSASDSKAAPKTPVFLVPVALRSAAFKCQRFRAVFDRFRVPVAPKQLFSNVFECQWLRRQLSSSVFEYTGSEDSCFRELQWSKFRTFGVPNYTNLNIDIAVIMVYMLKIRPLPQLPPAGST